ncbi:MAG: nucleotidyltransferase family protein [Gemmatimonadota bacterium]
MTPPAALVLAGGLSRRMPGASKLARPWEEGTVLGAVVRTARDAGLAPVAVVGRADEPLPAGAEAADLRLRVAPGGGRADSLALGLTELEPGPVVVLLGDEPGVRPDVITALVERCREARADAGRVAYADRPGHPVFLGPRGRATAAGLTGEAAVWDHVSRPPLKAVLLEVDEPAPIDVDTPAALERARRRREPR